MTGVWGGFRIWFRYEARWSPLCDATVGLRSACRGALTNVFSDTAPPDLFRDTDMYREAVPTEFLVTFAWTLVPMRKACR